MHIDKRGIRVLGISESFLKNRSRKSILAGVVIRGDLVVDGFSFSRTTVGGMDATDSVLELYQKLQRKDINFIFLNGCVISWFNIVNLGKVHKETGLPVVCVTYEESEGLERYLKEYFGAQAEDRITAYVENGEREELALHTGMTVFARYFGLDKKEAVRILNKFTLQGAIPDPLRIARLLARAIARQLPETIL